MIVNSLEGATLSISIIVMILYHVVFEQNEYFFYNKVQISVGKVNFISSTIVSYTVACRMRADRCVSFIVS